MSSLESTRTRLRRLGQVAATQEQLAEDARQARDLAIEEAEQEGLSHRVIAEAVGLSRPRVLQILVRRAAERQARARRSEG